MISKLLAAIVLAIGIPAYANIAVQSPVNKSQVSQSFTVTASADSCAGQPVGAMGYSIDDSTNTTIVTQSQFSATETSPLGEHVLHVKCWGNAGAADHSDIEIYVGTTVVRNIQQSNWNTNHDAGTSGNASGISVPTTVPSLSGMARQYSMNYTNYGGEIWYTVFGSDPLAKNFLYDADIYISSYNGLGNLEFDMNQVMANGQTVIYGVQCDRWSKTWDYTENAGTAANPQDTWIHSTQPCDPTTWAQNKWHHVRMSYSRDAQGNVLYNYVSVDGVKQVINQRVFSAFALGWDSVLLTNFQIDGANSTSGDATVYLDNVTVTRW